MKRTPFFYLLLCAFILTWPVAIHGADGPRESPEALAERIAALKLGFGDYVLGGTLNNAQQELARTQPEADARPGTDKFRDGESYVVADKTTHRILALYRKMDKVTRETLRQEVGRLMLRFGEPTTVAHEQMIYWAYGPEGHIAEEAYQHAKDSTATGLEVLATVKFKSSASISPPPPVAVPEGQAVPPPAAEEISCYTMISSEILLQHFMNK